MLESVQQTIAHSAARLGLSEAETEKLLRDEAVHEFEIALGSGKKFPAYRVQHNSKNGPYKGGIRFHPEVTRDEVRALAALMSIKTSLAGLPLGGGKGGVRVDPSALDKAELEELTRAYARGLHPHIGPDKDIPGPDLNITPELIDLMADEYDKLSGKPQAAFTGKSVGKGGSEGREESTGRGGVIVLAELLQRADMGGKPITYAIQGFGNVGAHFGLIAEAEQPHWKLVAATDSRGGVYDSGGFSAKDLHDFKLSGQKLSSFKKGRAITNEELLELEVDVLVLAALGGVVTPGNVSQILAHYILELANGPVDEAAEEILRDHGITLIPDALANAGGVIVSYFEWQQNLSGKHWAKQKVNDELEDYMVRATRAVADYAQEHGITLKEAAFDIAIKRLTGK